MKLHKSAVVAGLVATAMTLGYGTAHAGPAPAEGVNYAIQLLDKAVVTTLQGGTVAVVEKDIAAVEKELQPTADSETVGQEGAAGTEAAPSAEATETKKVKVAEIKDRSGKLVLEMPLRFSMNGTEIPVQAEVKDDDRVLVVKPEKPAGLDVSKPVDVKPIASPHEDQLAMGDFSSKFGVATAIGGFVGTALGAVVGCVITLVAGCLPGMVAGAGIGGVLGTIAVGGPSLVAAGMELMQTLQAAPGESKWANDGRPTEAAKKTEVAKEEAPVAEGAQK